MSKLEIKITLNNIPAFPCKTHKPSKLGYVERSEWADKMISKGKIQTQCNKCDRWYFKVEM